MKIYLGADHGGYSLKNKIKEWLTSDGYEVIDCGAHQLDPSDDYPVMAESVARAVAKDEKEGEDAAGILICRSGGGMVIAANKIKGIRAVEVFNPVSAKHAKEHNDANLVSIAADWLSWDEVKETVRTYLNSSFSKEVRHQRRINQIANLE